MNSISELEGFFSSHLTTEIIIRNSSSVLCIQCHLEQLEPSLS